MQKKKKRKKRRWGRQIREEKEEKMEESEKDKCLFNLTGREPPAVSERAYLRDNSPSLLFMAFLFP